MARGLPRPCFALCLCIAAAWLLDVLPWRAHRSFLVSAPSSSLLAARRECGRQGRLALLARHATDLNALTVPQLKDKLRKLGLKVGGKKAELIARLEEHAADEGEEEEVEEEEEEEEEAEVEEEEEEEEEEEPAPAPAPKAKAKKSVKKSAGGEIFEVGEAVDGFFEDDKDWYEAKVKEVLGGGKFKVTWDDGSGDYDCEPGYIRKKISEVDRNGPILPGEAVEALSDGQWYGGIVQADNGDGTFTLLWDEDGEEATVNEEDMKKTVPRMELEELTVGDAVKGVVTNLREFGAFVDVGAVRDGLIHISNMKPPEEGSDEFKTGDRVTAFFADDDEWYPATVDKKNKDGTYTITWDEDGDEPFKAKKDEIKLETPRMGVEINQQYDLWISKVEDGKLGLSMYAPGEKPQRTFLKKDLSPFADIDPNQWIDGEVVKLLSFGAFVKIKTPDGKAEGQGLVHVSRIREGFVEDIYAELEEGQSVSVRVESVDVSEGRMSLSMK